MGFWEHLDQFKDKKEVDSITSKALCVFIDIQDKCYDYGNECYYYGYPSRRILKKARRKVTRVLEGKFKPWETVGWLSVNEYMECVNALKRMFDRDPELKMKYYFWTSS